MEEYCGEWEEYCGEWEEYCGEWEESRQGLHINTLETIVACDAVLRCGTDAYIVLGVDNTTAISAIKRRMHENILISRSGGDIGWGTDPSGARTHSGSSR